MGSPLLLCPAARLLRTALFHAPFPPHTQHLYSLVFGESVLNDAVAIVLFHTLMGFHGAERLDLHAVTSGIGFFAVTFLGSIAIGVGVALGSALLFKRGHFQSSSAAATERALITLLPWLAYMLAEGLQLSGVVAILFAGIANAHYTVRNLTPRTRRFSLQLFKLLAGVCESLVFVYIGLATPQLFSADWSMLAPTSIVALLACALGRIANVAVCTSLTTALQTRHARAAARAARDAAPVLSSDEERGALGTPVRPATTDNTEALDAGPGAADAPDPAAMNEFGSPLRATWSMTTDLQPTRLYPVFQFVLWFVGLRGGVAFALARTARDSLPDREAGLLLQHTALVVVLVTTVGIGGSIGSIAKALRVVAEPGGSASGGQQMHFENAWAVAKYVVTGCMRCGWNTETRYTALDADEQEMERLREIPTSQSRAAADVHSRYGYSDGAAVKAETRSSRHSEASAISAAEPGSVDHQRSNSVQSALARAVAAVPKLPGWSRLDAAVLQPMFTSPPVESTLTADDSGDGNVARRPQGSAAMAATAATASTSSVTHASRHSSRSTPRYS